ncbi:thioredoxin [Spirochaeta africana]|uniref:Thioredoxin n=1 Tax=Spirochaeta africana (strain ATCC 700263 / DSM 8902 / Z-7692) TaxID=889378 RepID=H9UM32_SPIAZ|nr:thioredoxin [Spirochaeta africana]AFG38575.1 thioredoxin [Spirochaeta africana DSM 8902]
MEIEVTKDNFAAEVLEADVPVLVDFWADWCMPCKMVAPVLEELSATYAGKVKIAKVDVDSQGDLAAEYEVISIPTMVVFKGGEEVDRHLGAAPKDSLVQLLEKHL